MYIYENPNWPLFKWDNNLVLEALSRVKYTHGRLIGRMEPIGLTAEKESTLSTILMKTKFWQQYSCVSLNNRQINTLSFMIDKLEKNITSSQYAKIAKCSQDNAYRDLLDLINKHVVSTNENKGRSMSYRINI